jgi:hypothetical protein
MPWLKKNGLKNDLEITRIKSQRPGLHKNVSFGSRNPQIHELKNKLGKNFS